ncbi:trypsin-like peptidase domain-containing protein [Paucibacter sp. B2R-40]|uniref:trypsin-like peptidase domain-containing protein n=1 Tax=Paucibacter sp. B2R-40 TaxID=2893554 RepID=UPI0021E3B5A0|nr:trypsin-like peptidase domain-containing protein [Paucibacter sp. B2R-40]MCV2356646.1 trypsin-like peptidase domain-containing protein [Paucibacter sp. B2R-40]
MRKLWLIFAQTTTVVMAILFVLSTLKPEWLRPTTNPALPAANQPALSAAYPPALAASSGQRAGYSLASRRAAPAVVSITANKAPPRNSEAQDPWFKFHFGQRGRGKEAVRPQTGLGSGVIVSADGYLLTNNHVVEGASDIDVMLTDGRQARATLIGTDPESDLAVLKIALERLPVIHLGTADSLQVGDVVLAIGNPFNVGQTVTSGIVSALGRSQLGINTFENFIQTDAAINPGNSGGALVDVDGNLVGINTAIYSRNGGSLGIGFAIPISSARLVMDALLRDGEVARGWIGVQTRELTPEFAEAFKLPLTSGVLISGVLANAPAAKAGVKPGDVMTKVGRTAVQNPAQLLAAVAALPPLKPATLAVQRGERQIEIEVMVGQRPKPQPQPLQASDGER